MQAPEFDNGTLQEDVEKDEALSAFVAGYELALSDLGLKTIGSGELTKAFEEWWHGGP